MFIFQGQDILLLFQERICSHSRIKADWGYSSRVEHILSMKEAPGVQSLAQGKALHPPNTHKQNNLPFASTFWFILVLLLQCMGNKCRALQVLYHWATALPQRPSLRICPWFTMGCVFPYSTLLFSLQKSFFFGESLIIRLLFFRLTKGIKTWEMNKILSKITGSIKKIKLFILNNI